MVKQRRRSLRRMRGAAALMHTSLRAYAHSSSSFSLPRSLSQGEKLHPGDLKAALTKALNAILKVRRVSRRKSLRPEQRNKGTKERVASPAAQQAVAHLTHRRRQALACRDFGSCHQPPFPPLCPQPVRDHFNTDPTAKELLKKVKARASTSAAATRESSSRDAPDDCCCVPAHAASPRVVCWDVGVVGWVWLGLSMPAWQVK